MSRGVFRGGCVLRKTLSSLSADGWGCVSALLVVCLAWGIAALMPMNTPFYLHHQCPCHYSEPQPPPPPQETLQDQQVGLAQVPMKSLLFFLGPSAHKTFCAPSKSGVSISPEEFLQSSPTGLQSQMLWGLLLLMPDPQTGESDLGLITLTPVGEPLWYNYFPVCGSLIWRVWNLIVSWMHPSYRLVVVSSLPLDVEYLFS